MKQELENKDQVVVKVKVRPNSVKTAFMGKLADNTFKVNLKDKAYEGQANLALIKFLKQEFRPLLVDIKIISGQTSRLKLLKIIKLK